MNWNGKHGAEKTEQEKRGTYVNTQKTKISFAAAWLVAYLAGLKISGISSGIIGIQNLGQAIFRACFVIVMILYLKKRETLEFCGIRSLKNLDGRCFLHTASDLFCLCDRICIWSVLRSLSAKDKKKVTAINGK